MLLATLGARLRVTSARASAAEQRLVLAGEDTGIGIFDLDLVTRTVYLSPALALLCRVDATRRRRAGGRRDGAGMPREAAVEARAVRRRASCANAPRGYEREVRLTVPDGRERWLMLRVHIVWSGDRAVRMRGACIDITERRAVDDLLGRTQAELGQQVADLHRLHELSSRLLDARTLAEQLQMILVALADFHGARRGLLTLFDTALGHAGHRRQHRLHARRRRAPDADQRHRRRLRDLLRAARAHRHRGHRGRPTSTPACARWRARKASARCTPRR